MKTMKFIGAGAGLLLWICLVAYATATFLRGMHGACEMINLMMTMDSK